MAHAAKNALSENAKSYSTVHSYADRVKEFASFAKENGVNDWTKVTNELVQNYGQHLASQVADGEKAVSTAQNALSAVNRAAEAVRGDQAVRVSPSQLVGERSQVRTEPPAMDRAAVGRVADGTLNLESQQPSL